MGVDFTNPEDPEDRSFDPHPTHYPYATLEYPNTGASERLVYALDSISACFLRLPRFILLAPKDKDHYNPIMCLESSLHIIIERKRYSCLAGTYHPPHLQII